MISTFSNSLDFCVNKSLREMGSIIIYRVDGSFDCFIAPVSVDKGFIRIKFTFSTTNLNASY